MPYPTPMRDATGEVHVYRATPGTLAAEPPEYPHPDAPLTVNRPREAGKGIHPCVHRPLQQWREDYREAVGHWPEDDEHGRPVSGDETTRLAWCQCWDDVIHRNPGQKSFTGCEPCEDPACPHPQPHVAGQWFTRDHPGQGPRGVVPWFRDIARVLYPGGVIPVPVGDEIEPEDPDDPDCPADLELPRPEPVQLSIYDALEAMTP